ncbi:MAG: hypothetical protein GX221_09290 [Candidatus Riflebacteria bacterium]|nr:hypothetical protein [Candidatus Riflebacteria bacterium]
MTLNDEIGEEQELLFEPFTELADFSVAVEEMLYDNCTAYQCVATDQYDVGLYWNFLCEGDLPGFIYVEPLSGGEPGTEKVTLGLELMDITELPPEVLQNFLIANSNLAYCCFAIQSTSAGYISPEVILDMVKGIKEGDSEDDNSDESDEGDEEPSQETEQKIYLTLQLSMPMMGFVPDDFNNMLHTLACQIEWLEICLNENLLDMPMGVFAAPFSDEEQDI